MSNDHFVRFFYNNTSRCKWREDRRTAEKTLRKRRERYASDPVYVECIKESVRRRRKAHGPSDRKRSFNRDKIIIINGVSVCLYSRGKAAHLVGVSPRTIENWEKKGYIPVNRTKDAIGRRWYPAEFVVFLAEQVSNRSKKGCLAAWSERVKEAWTLHQLSGRPIPIVGDRLEDNDD